MKTIAWLTASYFIDVDRQIVPYLSKFYQIDWIIQGNQEIAPNIFHELKDENNLNLNLKIEYYGITSKWYSPKSYLDFYKFFKYIKQKKSDLIYIDSSLMFGAYYAASKLMPIDKTVIATHNVKTPKGARLEHFARFYMDVLLRKFINFHVFSRNQYDYLKSKVSGKNVLYAPLTLKNYGEKKTRRDNVNIINFLSFGHIRKYKRIDLLIEAAQLLYEETKQNFIVTIAGSCNEWEEYKSLIKYSHLFNLCIGYVSDDQVVSLFSNADFLVLPYQDLAQSGAITVAFNYNLPVITSDIPQFLEFVCHNQNGFLFESENVYALKEIMKQCLYMSPDHFERLQHSTKKYVKDNYSLISIAQKYIDYFNSLL